MTKCWVRKGLGKEGRNEGREGGFVLARSLVGSVHHEGEAETAGHCIHIQKAEGRQEVVSNRKALALIPALLQ